MALPRPGSPAPTYRQNPIRIACVQFDPKLGKVKENATRVQSLLSPLRPGSIDLLVLPEMALTGYMFTSPTAILPYLEQQRIGPTSLLCRSIAQRLRCHVIAGYPEAPSDSSRPTPSTDGGQSGSGSSVDAEINVNGATADGIMRKDVVSEGEGVGWNSAMVVGPHGDILGNYRKTFLFDTDKNWAKEGDGFAYFDLPVPLCRVAVGICMDMNPKDFVAPWDAFELATYCQSNKVDMLVVPMNWLEPPAEPPNIAPPQDPDAPSDSNLNYWAARLTPLHDPTPGYDSSPVENAVVQGSGEVVFVTCNRIGTEEGTTFVGTSSVMTISSDPSRIELVECCSVSEERVMLATVA